MVGSGVGKFGVQSAGTREDGFSASSNPHHWSICSLRVEKLSILLAVSIHLMVQNRSPNATEQPVYFFVETLGTGLLSACFF
jgi:hypothetical protein